MQQKVARHATMKVQMKQKIKATRNMVQTLGCRAAPHSKAH